MASASAPPMPHLLRPPYRATDYFEKFSKYRLGVGPR